VPATLITFAAEETSKLPFYVCGGLLVAWALLVSGIGIRADDRFPATKGARSGVMAISVLLILAAMASAVLTA
jgi:hypothetical protein